MTAVFPTSLAHARRPRGPPSRAGRRAPRPPAPLWRTTSAPTTRWRPPTSPSPSARWERVETGAGADIWLITWPVGSSTGWHDHGSASGAFVVLQGSLTEYVWTGVAHRLHAVVGPGPRVRRQPHPRRGQPRHPDRRLGARLRPVACCHDALRARPRPAAGVERRAARELLVTGAGTAVASAVASAVRHDGVDAMLADARSRLDRIDVETAYREALGRRTPRRHPARRPACGRG